MSRGELYVVLPCYNEEENITQLTNQWEEQEQTLRELGMGLRLVLINDGSKDRTLNYINDLAGIYNNISIIDHGCNKGLGQALNTGINYSLAREDIQYLCIMDGDSTHSPIYITDMISKMKKEKLDCVIASRYQNGSSVEGLSMFRNALSLGARIVFSQALRVPNVKDFTCGYRLYDANRLKILDEKYNHQIIETNGFDCMIELLYKIHLAGGKFGEVPFCLKYQLKGGKSKMKVFKTIKRSLMMVYKFSKLKQ